MCTFQIMKITFLRQSLLQSEDGMQTLQRHPHSPPKHTQPLELSCKSDTDRKQSAFLMYKPHCVPRYTQKRTQTHTGEKQICHASGCFMIINRNSSLNSEWNRITSHEQQDGWWQSSEWCRNGSHCYMLPRACNAITGRGKKKQFKMRRKNRKTLSVITTFSWVSFSFFKP